MLVRGGSLEAGMSQYLIDQICRYSQHQVRLNTRKAGRRRSTPSKRSPCSANGIEQTQAAAGLFVFIGACPTRTSSKASYADKRGFILTGPDLSGRRRPASLLATRARSVTSGDERAGDLRRRGRAGQCDPAGRIGGRAGRRGRQFHPQVPRNGVNTVQRLRTVPSSRSCPIEDLERLSVGIEEVHAPCRSGAVL